MEELEVRVGECERRVSCVEVDVREIKADCVREQVKLTRIETLLETNNKNFDRTLKAIVWIVGVVATLIAAGLGYNFVLPVFGG